MPRDAALAMVVGCGPGADRDEERPRRVHLKGAGTRADVGGRDGIGIVNSTDFESAERGDVSAERGDRADAPGAGAPGAGEAGRYGVVGLSDLGGPAAARIRRFLADSTIKGGSTPADVADLYLAAEILDDPRATEYLDRRYVHGEMPADWRALLDALTEAHFAAPRTPADQLLARVERQTGGPSRAPRSIFDDPEDLDEDEDAADDRSERLEERDPTLADLSEEGRAGVERMIVADVLCYGIAPYRVMELRERLRAAGDERALQYLDLPFELGDRPPDWDRLRDEALMLRARFELRGMDSSAEFDRAESQHPDTPARDLMGLMEDQADRR
jgi:hypothetical protein